MNLIDDLKQYLHKTLGVKIDLSKWGKRKNLPFFLVNTYDFYETRLFDQKCLLIIVKDESELTPGSIKKHFEKITKSSEQICILVQSSITSFNRARLIEQRIPFIVPGNQMYIPQIGLDLREYFALTQERRNTLTPSAQAIFLHSLISKRLEGISSSELAHTFKYTPMTISRIFEELKSLQLVSVKKKGKQHLLQLEENRKNLWEKAREFMRSPIRKRVWAKGKIPKTLAGLSALADSTMLTVPSIPVFAVYYKTWKNLCDIEVPDRDSASIEVEVWNYDPTLIGKKGYVDPFSLYLSLREIEDERIQIALEKLMENIEW